MKPLIRRDYTRQEIKRNELANLVWRAVEWAKNNKEAAMGIAFIAFIAILIAVYFYVQYTSLKKTAWERLAVAQSYAYSGQIQPSLEQLKDIAGRFSQAEAGYFAALFQGDIYYRAGKYKEAAESYQQILKSKAPKILLPPALSGLGAGQESQGDYASASETYKKFLDQYPEHYLAPQNQLALARSLELLKSAEAKQAYEKIILLYPETYWAVQARNRLTGSQTAPSKK